MVIIATGISGAGRKAYLKRFERYATAMGKSVKIYHIGELMLERARTEGLNITPKNILNTNKQTMAALRGAVYESVLTQFKADKKKYDLIVVSIHGFFYWKKTFSHSYDQSYISKFDPDVFLTIMGDPVDVKEELDSRDQWKRERLSQRDIILWQNVETEVMKTWADLNKKSFYAFYNMQSLATLYKIAFRPDMEKIYVSMPMTHLKEKKDRNRIARFIKKLEEYFVTIVPTVEKGALPEIHKGITKRSATQYTTSHQAVRTDLELLLDQSDRIIAFFPKPVSSPGVINELREAHETNKPAWLILPQKIASPFLTYYIDMTFPNEKKFYEFLEREFRKTKRFTGKLN